MTERPRDDRDVSDYVKRRMDDDLPPDFVGGVMSAVRATDQAEDRRGWPMLTGLVGVALATVLVVVAVGLLGRGDVGVTPSPSGSPPDTTAPAATESATVESPPPSASSVPADGEFGPIHSQTPDEAFGTGARTCEVTDAIVNGQPTDIGFEVSYPADWFTNEGTPERLACSVFAPDPFELGPGGALPSEAAITIDIPFGGDFDPLAPSIDSGRPTPTSVDTREYTVDGVAALRYEYPAQGDAPTAVIWIVAVAGELPGPANDSPYLFLASPGATDPERADELNDLLDRMVATLQIDSDADADGADDDD